MGPFNTLVLSIVETGLRSLHFACSAAIQREFCLLAQKLLRVLPSPRAWFNLFFHLDFQFYTRLRRSQLYCKSNKLHPGSLCLIVCLFPLDCLRAQDQQSFESDYPLVHIESNHLSNRMKRRIKYVLCWLF